jgi:ferredoxin
MSVSRWAKVIDNTRCIGCHACTTACKSENAVPVSVTRTYVKYVDVGAFPQARRLFQVTRVGRRCRSRPSDVASSAIAFRMRCPARVRCCSLCANATTHGATRRSRCNRSLVAHTLRCSAAPTVDTRRAGTSCFSGSGTLMAVPLDVRRQRLIGNAVPMVNDVAESGGRNVDANGVGRR